MDETAIKGLKLLELNDSGSDSGESNCCSSTSTTISVEGYDTSLRRYPLKLELEKHFASCGEIYNIYVPRDFERGILKSVAFMRIEGEGAEDKALQLSGTDVGGWTAIVKRAPYQKVFMDDPWYAGPRCAAAPAPADTKTYRIRVTGYDTSLPKIDMQIALYKHFSSCGSIWKVIVLSSGAAFIYLEGERCVDKALELSGRNMGGLTLVVEPVVPRPENLKRGRVRHCTTTGYTLPSTLLEVAKKKKKKMETEMEMEKEKEKALS
ncbi:RNA recognition motif domain [Arabidopsis suecica]|uniref:RNA recognition motif domain n=1 Tax=Arabidopsis suecica TaxID=45249 RepID=A0A8T1Z6I9_ARASU|nr:RNA recognition motif domain [Arabidopsis suecica]